MVSMTDGECDCLPVQKVGTSALLSGQADSTDAASYSAAVDQAIQSYLDIIQVGVGRGWGHLVCSLPG